MLSHVYLLSWNLEVFSLQQKQIDFVIPILVEGTVHWGVTTLEIWREMVLQHM